MYKYICTCRHCYILSTNLITRHLYRAHSIPEYVCVFLDYSRPDLNKECDLNQSLVRYSSRVVLSDQRLLGPNTNKIH